MLGCLLLLVAGGVSARAEEPVKAGEPVKVAMTAERWRMLDADSMGPKGSAEFVRKEGFPQGVLTLKAGSAALNGLTFQDGTIEYDFKALAADMPGVQFRVSGPDRAPEGEEVYLRMFGTRRPRTTGFSMRR